MDDFLSDFVLPGFSPNWLFICKYSHGERGSQVRSSDSSLISISNSSVMQRGDADPMSPPQHRPGAEFKGSEVELIHGNEMSCGDSQDFCRRTSCVSRSDVAPTAFLFPSLLWLYATHAFSWLCICGVFVSFHVLLHCAEPSGLPYVFFFLLLLPLHVWINISMLF